MPRLYLMITVGTYVFFVFFISQGAVCWVKGQQEAKLMRNRVYMSIEDAPVKEIMKDMMEMSRGVQHPIRYDVSIHFGWDGL